MKEKIIYYNDLKNDDFSGTHIKTTPLKDNYKYIHKNPFWIITAGFVYFIFAKPIIFFITKFICHQTFANKKVIKETKKTGGIVYGNHTTMLADAFVPNLLFRWKRNYIISSPETMSIKGIKWLLQMLGVLPLTDNLTLKKKFLRSLKYFLEKNKIITLYPEAHIWPYYTKIRDFDETSFKYAALFNKPVFALTNCYQKRKFGKKPRIVTYIDGPFYPKSELNTKENAKYLRELVYNAMVDRTTKYSTYSYIKYIKIEDKINKQ